MYTNIIRMEEAYIVTRLDYKTYVCNQLVVNLKNVQLGLLYSWLFDLVACHNHRRLQSVNARGSSC